jgi:hypothetical protein
MRQNQARQAQEIAAVIAQMKVCQDQFQQQYQAIQQ